MEGALFFIGAMIILGCEIPLIIEAFEFGFLEGFLALCVPLYLIYFAIFESCHDRRWALLIGMFVGTVIMVAGPLMLHSA
jgi:hypothetical protein